MENTQKKVMPLWQCGLIVAVGVILMLVGILSISKYCLEAAEAKENMEVQWFDVYSSSDELQGVEFLLISDAFAEYTYGTAQGFYFVFDEEMCGYIVCMEQDRIAEEFQANYDYTYTDMETVPELGYVEGYAVEIDEEIREYAMESFNLLVDEEVIDETNFEDYLGAYYLDTTIEPAAENNNVSTAVVMIIVGVILLVVAIVKMKNRDKLIKEQEQREREERERILNQASYDANNPYMSDPEMPGGTTNTETVYSGTMEVEKQGNIIVALIASAICACAGAVLWVLIYRLGYIAGITGCVAAVGALFGYEKIGKRQVGGGAVVWSVFISLVVLLLGNAVAYAWEFTDVMSAGSPGRAEFFVVLKQLPSILKEYDCIGSFFGDWGMGVFFAAISGFSIGNRKK